MKVFNVFLCLTFCLVLSACSEVDNDQKVDFSTWERAYMVYSYPFDGQQNVSVKTSVSLMFTHEIDDEYLKSHFVVSNEDGEEIKGSVSAQYGNDAGLVFTPEQPLLAGERYTVSYEGVNSEIGLIEDPRDIRFTTVGVSSSDRQARDGEVDPYAFEVIREFPEDDLPFMDFSVIHLTFNQNLDVSTIVFDDTFSFTEAGQTQSVAGKLVVKDSYIIFDPENDLKPGVEYTLRLKDSIKARSGVSLSAGVYASKVYVPQDSQPRSLMVQKIFGEPEVNVSPLSGLDRNTVPVNSTLMGDVISYAQADYYTELGFIPNFPDAVPFVIRRGAVIKGSKMPVNIGGEVPAGFDTGEIYLTLITDATGYMIKNSYTDDVNAPKLVKMVLDVSMSAQDPRANGGLSQDVLHIDLFGLGMTENGVLVVDTLGEINPVLLGVEKANGLVSFFLEAYADQDNAPARVLDETPPELQTWLPGDIIDRVDAADPLMLIFTEPLQPENLAQQITLNKLGESVKAIGVTVTHDGTSVIIKPDLPLDFDSEYMISVGGEVKDIAGNAVTAAFSKTFSTLSFGHENLAAPLVGSIHPGYNCKLTAMDVINNIAGRCEGGKESDDQFTVFKHPSNRALYITFNQLMDTSTFVLGSQCGDNADATLEQKGSIRVEELDPETGACIKPVDGNIHFDGSRISFEPIVPWDEDKLYQTVLNSNVSSACTGSDLVLCSATGLPLRTVPLTLTTQNAHEGSGPLVMPFKAKAPENLKVFNPLSKLPVVDVNRNFLLDENESIDDSTQSPTIENASKLSIEDFGGLIKKAKMGCAVNVAEQDCPAEKKSIYVSGYLPTEIGLFEELQGGGKIPVELHSQALMTTSVTMYTEAILWISIVAPTGPQIMRMRGRYDPETGESLPAIGYISWDETYDNGEGNQPGHAVFESIMEVYLDAPGLVPTAPILGQMETNMHSLPLTINLYGPIVFLPDGRMEIKLQNTNTVDIDVEVGDSSHVDLKIYPQDLSINLVSKMVKS